MTMIANLPVALRRRISDLYAMPQAFRNEAEKDLRAATTSRLESTDDQLQPLCLRQLAALWPSGIWAQGSGLR